MATDCPGKSQTYTEHLPAWVCTLFHYHCHC